MRVVGVDLAAGRRGTALAVLDGMTVVDLTVGVSDACVVAAAEGADKLGIDCPLGWPNAFVDFVNAHRDGHVPLPPGGIGEEHEDAATDAKNTNDAVNGAQRQRLAYRVTDEAVRGAFPGLVPLSVAADRIAHTAMRCAGLLSALAAAGHGVKRDGSELVVEVYPAASLRYWKQNHRRYKGNRNLDALGTLTDMLAEHVDLGQYVDRCRASDHAFDAVIAALTARAAALGRTTPPSAGQRAVALTEGWIAVPSRPLADLRA
ncbi:MAG TPA: DUF429 domain-containing protein [Pseudonocardiaceae bacterium]